MVPDLLHHLHVHGRAYDLRAAVYGVNCARGDRLFARRCRGPLRRHCHPLPELQTRLPAGVIEDLGRPAVVDAVARALRQAALLLLPTSRGTSRREGPGASIRLVNTSDSYNS